MRGAHGPRCPVDLVADGHDRVYVADTTHRAVLVYDLRGHFVASLVPDVEQEAFRPSCLAMGEDVLYVGDVGGRCVRRYDLVGQRWLRCWSPPDGHQPLAAPTGLAMAQDGSLLVVDALSCCLHRVDTDGRWLDPVGRRGRGAGEFVRPKQVAVTSTGLICVVDAGRQSVLVFDEGGKPVVEVAARDMFAGWTMPAGLLVVGADLVRSPDRGDTDVPEDVDELLIVSDVLGAVPLTVLSLPCRGGSS